MSTPPIEVPVTKPVHIMQCATWMALLALVEELKAVPASQRTPGFALAEAIVERRTSDEKARAIIENLRAVSSAGIDLAATRSVNIRSGAGSFVLEIEMMDLADLGGGE